MIPQAASPSEASQIVELIREAFPGPVMEGLVVGCPGIHHFIADQILLGALSPYRHRVIRHEGRVVAAAEFRLIDDALWLNYLVVHPEHHRRGLAKSLILAERNIAAAQGFRRFVLDVFTHNQEAYTFYTNNWKMRMGQLTNVWALPMPRHFGGTEGLVEDFPQAESVHARLGFSEITVCLGTRRVRVGRLGSRFFRLTDSNLLDDHDLLHLLHQLDPTRDLLVMTGPEFMAPSDWDRLFAIQRLEADILG